MISPLTSPRDLSVTSRDLPLVCRGLALRRCRTPDLLYQMDDAAMKQVRSLGVPTLDYLGLTESRPDGTSDNRPRPGWHQSCLCLVHVAAWHSGHAR